MKIRAVVRCKVAGIIRSSHANDHQASPTCTDSIWDDHLGSGDEAKSGIWYIDSVIVVNAML
jgi:hypothetical protein